MNTPFGNLDLKDPAQAKHVLKQIQRYNDLARRPEVKQHMNMLVNGTDPRHPNNHQRMVEINEKLHGR